MKNNHRQIIDLKGFRCPLPVLKLKKKIAQIKQSCKIEVQLDDPLAMIDIPAFCQQRNYLCKCYKKIDGQIICHIEVIKN